MWDMLQVKEFVKISSKAEYSESLLELIWHYYTLNNPVSNEEIDACFLEIEPVITQLSQKRKRRIRRLIGDLCVEQERAAFIEGMRVGGRLVMELREDECRPAEEMDHETASEG